MNQVIVPSHIALIPDGNRRWAKERGLPTIEGHRRGFSNIVKLTKKIRSLGISTFTVWAFSTENWQRSKEEIKYLMKLYELMVDGHIKAAISDNVRLFHIGRKDRIPKSLLAKINEAEEKTKQFDTYFMNIALDYGGRDEIVRAINSISDSKHSTVNISEENISSHLDLTSQPYPNPDIIIRTGKEYRLSGFMLWQSQYSELFFPEVFFPDFSTNHLEKIIAEYAERMRRFGK